MAAIYPKREAYFAHRFVRLLTKTAAANDLGPAACWLLSVVAMQEDSKRYRGAVTFYNWQLLPLCGFTSEKQLISARTAAIEGGWLHYESGGKKVPGRYWCLTPNASSDAEDAPIDEGDAICPPFSLPILPEETTGKVQEKCRESDRENGGEVQGKGVPFIPSPIPDPIPEEESLSADADSQPVEDSLTAHQVVVTEWNSVGPVRCSRLTPTRRKALAARLRDAWWRENWREGLARLPNARFACGENERKWKADFDWFLKPDSLTRLLEGKYDHAATESPRRANGPVVGPGDRYEPDRPISPSDFDR